MTYFPSLLLLSPLTFNAVPANNNTEALLSLTRWPAIPTTEYFIAQVADAAKSEGRAATDLQLSIKVSRTGALASARLRSRHSAGPDTSSGSEPALQIILKNVGMEFRDLLVGYESSAGPVYSVTLTAHAPQARELQVFDRNALKAIAAGPPLPITTHLEPGGMQEFTYLLNQLLCVVNRQDIPLRTLLERGYTLRASFELGGVTVVSSEFSLPN